MDVLNIAVGLTSLVLGGFAIFLSVYFYTKAKDTEKDTAKTLEGIKAQTETLQRLTGRWMDRFTRYATEPHPADEGLMMLASAMADLPTTILTHLRLQAPTTTSNEPLISELVSCYILLYFYTAVANVMGQALLPGPDNFDPSIPEHANIKRIIDRSFTDFATIADIITRVDASRLDANYYRNLLLEAQGLWRPLIRNTDSSLASRRK